MTSKFIPQMQPWFDKEEINAVHSYMQSDGWLTEFKKTEELERKIAKFTGSKYCIMTVNGTVSLILALLALGINPGDEVLVPDITMIASPNSVKLLGARPVLVDVELGTYCIDLELARRAITAKTKALMYVSLNGRSYDMRKVKEFCRKHKLALIEDSAQSLGSYSGKKHLGTFGDIGTLSFAVPKIITMGQGGALLTNNVRLYKKIKLLKDFGRTRGGIDTHDEWGWNFKFTDLQAVIGIEQMKKLPYRIKRKKEIYKMYENGLCDIREISFVQTNLSETTPWSIDIYVKHADRLATFLKKQNIGTRRVYPAIHTQKIYRKMGYQTRFPVARRYATTGLWLPSSTNLTNKQIDYIVKNINQYYSSGSPS